MSSRAESGQSAFQQIVKVINEGLGQVVPIPLLFLFAHPDDESIAASLLLARTENPHILFLTDGAPRDQQYWSPDATGDRSQYGALRRQEALDALRCAGLGDRHVTWLNAIDQEAVYSWSTLAAELTKLILAKRPDAVISHAYEGGHPDHDTAALIARCAVEDASERGMYCELLEVPLYHACDGDLVTSRFLPSNQDGGLASGAAKFRLTAPESARKERMMHCHHSQRRVLQPFHGESEFLRPAPIYAFTRPPHPGKLWYETLGWPMTGQKWREMANTAHVGFKT